MSGAGSFRHLPDLPLITWFAENNRTLFTDVSPWSKITLLVLLVITVTVIRSLPILLVSYALVVAACICARLPLKRIVLWYTLPALFVLSLVGIIAWSEPGTTVLSFTIAGFTATLTDGGIRLIIVLLIKAFIIVTYSFFFLMTTRYEYIAGLIDRIFPDPVNQIFLLSYRFLFLTIDLIGSLLKAVRSRSGGMVRSIWMQGRIFARIFALTFIRSLDRGEKVHAAMISRGYRGTYATATPVPQPSVLGIIGIVLASAATAALVILTEILPGGFIP